MGESTPAGTVQQNLAQFKRDAMAVLAQIGAQQELAASDVRTYVMRAGLPATGIKAKEGGTYVLPEIADEPDAGDGPGGMPREDFTQARLDRHDQDNLTQLRQNTYSTLQRVKSNTFVTMDDLTAALEKLGLPVPVTITEVSAEVTGIGHISFKLPGDVSEADVRAKLADKVKDPKADAIREAFGADVEGLSDGVTWLSVNPVQKWAPVSDVA